MPESHEWEKARAATRQQVRAAFRSRPQTCPACGATTETSAALCPQCRAPYAIKEKGFAITPLRAAVAAATVAALVLIAVLLVPGERRSAASRQRAEAAAQRRLVAAEIVRLRRDVRPVYVDGPAPPARGGTNRPAGADVALAYRARLVAFGEARITGNARERIAEGTMDGPVTGTECRPFPTTATRAALEDDLAVTRRRYSCIAFERRFELTPLQGRERTGLIGQPFWLVADDTTGRLVFCKVTPRAGEGGRSLAAVRVPAPCRDPDDD